VTRSSRGRVFAFLTKVLRTVILVAGVGGLLTGLAAAGLAGGWWRPNHPDPRRLPEWGVDVSHHQGRIDWHRVATHPHLRFAYLKATEGGDWTDPAFEKNWEGARGAGLRVGAYHFFTFCTDPAVQAQHFLANVPKAPDALPPAVDVEFGGNCSRSPTREQLRRDLKIFVETVERGLEKKPVLYVTNDAYRAFFEGAPVENPLWIRNVWFEPEQPAWALWQFANRGRVAGIDGFVDLNVARGDGPAPGDVLAP
jgi:lysozyme